VSGRCHSGDREMLPLVIQARPRGRNLANPRAIKLCRETGNARIAGFANGSSEGRPQSLVIRAPRVLDRASIGLHSVGTPTTEGARWNVFCGIDWAEQHHDVALVDIAGQLVIKRRISDNLDGFIELLDILAGAGDSPDDPIPVAIETSHGLLVAALRATGREVYAINPMAVARYRT
jgi:transposase